MSDRVPIKRLGLMGLSQKTAEYMHIVGPNASLCHQPTVWDTWEMTHIQLSTSQFAVLELLHTADGCMVTSIVYGDTRGFLN